MDYLIDLRNKRYKRDKFTVQTADSPMNYKDIYFFLCSNYPSIFVL